MTGAGKTFLMQIMALRLRQQGIQVFILAPLKGHEFAEVCNMIGGKYNGLYKYYGNPKKNS